MLVTVATLVCCGDCSLESVFPPSILPLRTLLTLNRPFLVKELVLVAVPSVPVPEVTLNRPFLVKVLELESVEPYPIVG
jgi:hypothetical protein